ncbi:MAG: alpha/beta hydrolase [Candidatus Hodarchaeota archaeon]
MQKIIFIHGLLSSGEGFKGKLLKEIFTDCLTPNFTPYNPKISIKNLLKERMQQLISFLKDEAQWIVIGSSFGGLMGTLFTLKFPSKVSKLILLAPYLSTEVLDIKVYSPINVPVIAFHGKYDKVIPFKRSRIFAEKLFTNIEYNVVDDDHTLKKTVLALDWKKLIYNK